MSWYGVNVTHENDSHWVTSHTHTHVHTIITGRSVFVPEQQVQSECECVCVWATPVDRRSAINRCRMKLRSHSLHLQLCHTHDCNRTGHSLSKVHVKRVDEDERWRREPHHLDGSNIGGSDSWRCVYWWLLIWVQSHPQVMRLNIRTDAV